MAKNSEKRCLIKGVPAKEMSGREDTGRGEVPGGGVRPPEGPEASEPQGSGPDSGSGSDAVEQGLGMVGTPSSCQAAMFTAPLM